MRQPVSTARLYRLPFTITIPLQLPGRRSHSSATMPPKRKRSLQQQQLAQAPSTPLEGPRRSHRRKDMVASQIISNGGRIMSETQSQERKPEQGVWNNTEGVKQAMRDLSEMEHQLQNVVRQQRLAVETSELVADPRPANEQGLVLQPYVPVSEVINDRHKRESKDEDQDYPDGPQTVKAEEFDVEGGIEETAAERGSRRPPPVNSATLPLPWKGRLGYVSRPRR